MTKGVGDLWKDLMWTFFNTVQPHIEKAIIEDRLDVAEILNKIRGEIIESIDEIKE